MKRGGVPLRAEIFERAFERVGPHAVGVDGQPDHPDAEVAIRRDRSGVGEFFGDDDVVVVFDQRLGHQRHGLHRAVRQRNPIRRHRYALALRFALRHQLAQSFVAEFAGIVRVVRIVALDRARRGALKRFERKRRGIGAPHREVVDHESPNRLEAGPCVP